MRFRQLFFLVVLFPGLSWARVFLHWTNNVVPARKDLGVSELAIPWSSGRIPVIGSAAALGYRVYIECTLQEAAGLANAATEYGAAGIIVHPEDAQLSSAWRAVRRLRAAHPKIAVLLVNPSATQPQLKGTLVINRDGVLQVASPTAQPWLDTNLALVRLEQAFRPAQVPLYSFNWNLAEATRQQKPAVADYELAVAEAGAFKADLVLSLDNTLQNALAQNEEKAWAEWRRISRYLQFYAEAKGSLRPEVNVAVITNDDSQSFEPVNLLARHNIGVKVFRATEVGESTLRTYGVAIVFASLGPQLISSISQFASSGRTAVVVNDSGKNYPWHSNKATPSGAVSSEYAVKKGRVIELQEPVSDPETFARDIRGLIDNSEVPISLWNALTTLGVLYDVGQTGDKLVELVNYAEDPLEVQVKVKGVFSEIRYQSPESGCCERITPVIHDGFTEFQVPSLTISGRVHLHQGKSAPVSAALQK